VSLRRTRPGLRVIPPFFWDTSGRATIHGFITTALKLCGESIFLRAYDEPDYVTAVHAWITSVYIALIQHYSQLGALPVTSVHIGECSGTMLRPEHFAEFVVPCASRVGRELGAVRFHSCGRSDHLLAAIARIENLRILDCGSGTSVAAIRARFGREFPIHLAPPAELLLKDAPRAGVEAWLERTLAENAGGPLQIAFHLEPGYSLENCLAIHEGLRRRQGGP
jgi:uroporphyrinogen-III decarboxylase